MEYAIMPLKSTVNDVIATSGFDAIDMRHDTLFGSREDAQAAIEAAADPCAVRFKCVALDTLEPTVTMNQIEDRIRRMGEQRDKYTAEHSIHTLAAKLITCTKCESPKTGLKANSAQCAATTCEAPTSRRRLQRTTRRSPTWSSRSLTHANAR